MSYLSFLELLKEYIKSLEEEEDYFTDTDTDSDTDTD